MKNITNEFSPNILGISEANFKKDHNIQDVQIDDYQLYFPKTLQNNNIKIGRLAVYVHNDLVVTVRNDLMNDTIHSVWLECGLPRQKKILVCNMYRQWQLLGQGEDKSSSTIQSQMERFILFLNQWEKAISTGKEIIVLGDFNLNFLDFGLDSTNMSNQSYRLQPLVKDLFERIVPNGFVQMVTSFSRSWPYQ